VAGEGKCFGKSFHREPVLSTHAIPSKQRRGSTRGRPPAGEGSGVSNRSAIRNHFLSVSSDSGSVLDPVWLRPHPVDLQRGPPRQGHFHGVGLLSHALTRNSLAKTLRPIGF
jgi:hypothetical protein